MTELQIPQPTEPTQPDNTTQENTTEPENVPQPTEPTESDNIPQENSTAIDPDDIYDYFEPNDNETDVIVSSTPQPEKTTQSEQMVTSIETGYVSSTPEPKEILSENPKSQNTYTVRMVLSLPMTIETFNYEVQTTFKDALAQAVGVASNTISIDSIVANVQRRLLSESIIVQTSIMAVDEGSATNMMSSLTSDNININLVRSGLPSVTVIEQARSVKNIVAPVIVYAECAKNTYQQCDQTGNCSSCALCPDNMISVRGSKNVLNCTKSTQVFVLDTKVASLFNFENWPRQHSLKFRENTFIINTAITMKMVSNLSIFPDPASLENKDVLHLQINNSESFIVPVTLTITYSGERPGFVPTIETYDDVLQTWVEVSTNYNNNKLLKTVSVDVMHFSFWTSNWKQTSVDYYRQKTRSESDNSFSTKLNMFMLFIMSLMFLVFLFFINRFISNEHRILDEDDKP